MEDKKNSPANENEAMEQELGSFFEFSPDCMFKVRLSDFKLVAANALAVKMFGYSKEEFLQMSVPDLEFDEDILNALPHAAKSLPIGSSFEAEGLEKRKDGKMFPAFVRLSRVDEDFTFVILRDITQQKAAQEELFSDKKKINELLSNINEIVFTVALKNTDSTDNPITYLNGDTIRLFGYTNQELIDDPLLWGGCIHPGDLEYILKQTATFYKTKQRTIRQYRFKHKDGHYVWLEDNLSVGKVVEAEIPKIYGSIRDITDRKLAQEAILENERKVNELLFNINEIVFSVDLIDTEKYDNPITYVNGDTLRIFGYTHEEMIEVSTLWTDRIHPDDLEAVIAISEQLHKTKKQIVREYRFQHKKGHYIWIEDNLSLGLNLDKTKGKLYGSARNISARKKAEALFTSNEEKEVLLQEIHHRVKNNLQVITSLLSLQSSFLEDETQKKLFADSQYRINSMAMVHEMLYQSQDLSKLDYEHYLNELSQFLIQSMKGRENGIILQMDVPQIKLNIDTAVPLGLLINEVLTNSLKYGIPEDKAGIISIKIKKEKPSSKNKKSAFLLEIGDDGVGYSDEINFRNTKSLGLKLINNLIHQLEGTVKKDNSKKGTNYIIYFYEI